jgi:dipeptidyl aminopeptidase/acylaminoacyl peptidase
MTTASASATVPASPRRKYLLFFLAGLIVIALGAYIVITRIAYDRMSLTGDLRPELLPDTPYEEVSFPSRGRDYPVYAFWQTTTPDAPVIINVHGYKNSRYTDYIQNRADILVRLGYNVLSPDLADNSGKTFEDGRISMGFDERYDVLGAYDYLIAQGFTPDKIGLVSESMGAATSLLTAAMEPTIKVIWADSPFSDAPTVLGEQAEVLGMPRFVVSGGLLWGQILSNDNVFEASPIKVADVLAANDQAVYLVTCTTDAVVNPHHAHDLYPVYQDAGVDVQLWEIGCDQHATGILFAPEEYTERLRDFLQRLPGSPS